MWLTAKITVKERNSHVKPKKVIRMERELKSDIQDFPISEIKGFFYQRQIFDKDRLNELAKDISQKGVLKNVVITKKLLSNDTKKVIGENMVVAGFRTTKASIMAKRKTIPARIYDTLTELEATDILLSENIHFEEMSDFDISQNINRYVVAGIMQKDIAERINRSESYVSQYLALMKDTEPIREALAERDETFTEKHARIVRALPEKLHKRAVEVVKGRTVKEAKEVVKELAEENKAVMVKAQIKELEEQLKDLEKAEDEKRAIEEQISQLNGQIRALKPSSKDIQRLIGKIERIRIGYFPRKERLAELKARAKEIQKTLPNYDIEVLKKDREKVYGDLAKRDEKIKALQEQIAKEKEEGKKLKDEAKRLTEQIELIVSSKRELAKINEESKSLTKAMEDIEKDYHTEIKDFDKLTATIKNSEKELLERRESLFRQIADLKTKQRSLNGKIANKNMIQKRLENLKSHLKNLKA